MLAAVSYILKGALIKCYKDKRNATQRKSELEHVHITYRQNKPTYTYTTAYCHA